MYFHNLRVSNNFVIVICLMWDICLARSVHATHASPPEVFFHFFPPPPKHLLNSNRQRTAAFTRCTDRKAHRADAIVIFTFINTIDTTRWSHWQQPHQRFRDLITRKPKTVVTAPVGKWELYYITQTLYIQSLSKHFTYTVSPEKNWLQRILGARPRSLTSNTSEHFTTNRADLSMPDSWKKQPPRTLHINVLYKLLLHNDVLYKKNNNCFAMSLEKTSTGFQWAAAPMATRRWWKERKVHDKQPRRGRGRTDTDASLEILTCFEDIWKKKRKRKKKHLWLSCAKANMTFMNKKKQKGKQIS